MLKRRRGLRVAGATGLAVALLGVAGCRSAFVQATVTNASSGDVSPVEVSYPSASFGTERLAQGGVYHYRFKILGSGGTKVTWTDARHAEHSVNGPALHEGQAGSLEITLRDGSAEWKYEGGK